MGLFSSVGRAVSNVIAPGRKLLFGGEAKPQFAPFQRIELPAEQKKTVEFAQRAQRRGLGELEQQLSTGRLQNIAREKIRAQKAEVGGLERAARAGTEDARRRLQTLIAQRGLQRSGIGLGQEIGLQRQQAERLAALQQQRRVLEEQLPLLEAQAALQRPQMLIRGAGQVLGQPGAAGPIAIGSMQRSPGLAGILGLLGGAAVGSKAGPMGALVGGQLGQATGQGLSGAFGRG